MAFCSKCGKQLADGAKFCPSCGTPTNESDDGSKRKQLFVGEIRKCPHCGEVIEGFEAKCPACGQELNKKTSSEIFSFRNEIIEVDKEIQQEADSKPKPKEWWKDWNLIKKILYVILNIYTLLIPLILHFVITGVKAVNGGDSKTMTPAEKRKQQTIQSFIIPNNKEGVMEFLTYAKGNRDVEIVNASEKKWRTIWNNKCLQVIEKAKALYANDSKFQAFLTDEKNACDQISKSMRMKAIIPSAILAVAVFVLGSLLSLWLGGTFTKLNVTEKRIEASEVSIQKTLAEFINITSDIVISVDENNDYAVTVSMEVTGIKDCSYSEQLDKTIDEFIESKGWKETDVKVESSGSYSGYNYLKFTGYSDKYSLKGTDSAERVISELKNNNSCNIHFTVYDGNAISNKSKKQFANRIMNDTDFYLSFALQKQVRGADGENYYFSIGDK